MYVRVVGRGVYVVEIKEKHKYACICMCVGRLYVY